MLALMAAQLCNAVRHHGLVGTSEHVRQGICAHHQGGGKVDDSNISLGCSKKELINPF